MARALSALLVGLAVAGGAAPDPWRERTQPLRFVIKESEIESWKSWTGPLISERYRLILWALPKVGCTDMMRLFYRMAGHDAWRELPWRFSRLSRVAVSVHTFHRCLPPLSRLPW